jgi:peptidyl-prolyl cis-trans isomerase A (cyclophilin A)
MTRICRLVRLALIPALLAAPVLPAHAAKTEAQIQAEIEAKLKAEEAKEAAAKKAAAAAAAAAAEAAQSAPPPVPVPPPAPPAPVVPARVYKTVPVILTTSMGPITIALEVERAPITANYFLRYVDEKRLDGTVFYRAFTFAPDFPNVGMIQGGTQNDPKRILKPVAHEPTSKTGLSHDDGAISLAQNGPGTATADFFITIGEMHSLDAKPGGDAGFAVFGHVTAGMDLVRRIAVAPRSPTKGDGAMKGQMLEPPIRILTARRAPDPAP